MSVLLYRRFVEGAYSRRIDWGIEGAVRGMGTKMTSVWRIVGLSLLLTAAQLSAAPGTVAGDGMSLTALNEIESGLWQLEVKGQAPRQLCVADPLVLMQIEHEQSGCSRFVIANDAKAATVHYSCQRSGWGRTTVRVATPRSATIQTQGIARNAPFDYVVQARRVGDCSPQVTARQR